MATRGKKVEIYYTSQGTTTGVDSSALLFDGKNLAIITHGKTFKGTDTWEAVSTSQDGYIPQLASGGGSIATQASEYVLTYKDGVDSTPTWKLLPTNAFLDTNDDTWIAADVNNAGYVPHSVKGKYLHANDSTGALEWVDDHTYTVNNNTFSIKSLVGSTTTTLSDFTANQGSDDDFTLVQGSNITFTVDATNRKLTIAGTANTWQAANASQEGYVPKSTANKILRSNNDGALYWGDDTNTWRPVGTGATDAAAGNHTHGISIAADSGTNQISLAAGTKYKLTAGGQSYIFTMPSDNNTTYSGSSTVTLTGTTFSLTKANVTTALGYTPPTTNSTYNFSGTTFRSGYSSAESHNCNDAWENGHYYYSSNGPSTSIGASTSDGALYVQNYSSSWVGQIAQDYRNGRCFFRGKNNGSWTSWLTNIDSGNISSQSVNYANSAGSASSATTASKATNLLPENTPHYFRDPGTSGWTGGMFWGSSGSEAMSFIVRNAGTRFQFVGNSDISTWKSDTWASVTPYLTISSSGISTPGTVTASSFSGSIAWSSITGKPFNWSGQSGQPSWLWGSNDGSNYYVWNPSNFSVNYANSAGSVAWSNVTGKPGPQTSYPAVYSAQLSTGQTKYLGIGNKYGLFLMEVGYSGYSRLYYSDHWGIYSIAGGNTMGIELVHPGGGDIGIYNGSSVNGIAVKVTFYGAAD